MYGELESKKGLPARYFSKPSKLSNKIKEVFMDAFEDEALLQFRENIERFGDYYRMYDGELSTVELREFAPYLEQMGVTDLFDGYDIPSNVYHHDLIGRVIKAFVGKLSDMEDKFFITDLGEEGQSDFLKSLEGIYHDILSKLIQIAVQRGFAKEGIDPNSQQQFQSEEEQQQYLMMLQQKEEELSPDSAVKALKTSFKSAGAKWGEATLEKDEAELDFKAIYAELLKNFLLSGTIASIVKIYENNYKKFAIDSRQVFHSKDVSTKYLQDFDYAGILSYMNDTQVISEFGDFFNTKETEEILGGKDGKWYLDDYEDEYGHTSPKKFLSGNFGFVEDVPYHGYRHAKMMRRLQDMSGEPMGFTRRMSETGEFVDTPSYITDLGGVHYQYNNVFHIENRFIPNNNLFQVTDVYFKAYEPVGFYFHETEEGFPTMTVVDSDINREMLRENGVKEIKTMSYKELSEEQPVNTIVWTTRAKVWRGVKISSPRLKRSYYPIFEPMEFQITGDNDFDVKLPITGYVGKGIAENMSWAQYGFNVALNQSRQLMEKELGMFFSIDLMSLPTSIQESGEVEDVMMNMRNMAKTIGLLPTMSNPDDLQNGGNHRNLFGVHNVSHQNEIQTRLQLADYYEVKCYQAAGLNMAKELSDTKHVTATGIKLSNETMSNQIADVFDQFNSFVRTDKIQHLSVAQYAQSNGHDISLYYTKSDATIEWLNFTDEHKIPFRRLGLTITSDSKRRKEFEDVKMWLLNNNTMQGDIKALIDLTTSDTMSYLLESANEAREYAQEQAQIEHQNQMQQIQANAEAQEAIDQKRWERDEISKERDRQNKIQVERIESYGRAADANATAETFDRIDRAIRVEQEDTKIANDYEAKMAKIDLTNALAKNNRSLKERELDQRDRALDIREKEANIKQEGNRINKN